MKFDIAISSLPVIKYNIQYYNGNNKAWQQVLERLSGQVITTFPEFDIDLTEIQEKLNGLGIHSIEELSDLIDEYNEMKEKLEEIESLL